MSLKQVVNALTPSKETSASKKAKTDGVQDEMEKLPPISSTPTLADIGKLLDQKLSPVTESLESLRGDLTNFKESVRKELQDMGCKLKDFETTSTETSSRMTQIEKEIAALKVGGPPKSDVFNERANTIVIGKLPNKITLDEAKDWIQKICSDAGLPPPVDVYSKGDFKGLLFAKCMSGAHRDQLIANISIAPGDSWAQQDRPLDTRTACGTLFGFKRMLCEWGYNKSCIKVDPDTGTLSVAGKEVLKVAVKDFVLSLTWSDGQCEEWGDLQDSTELATLKDVGQDKLNKAKSFGSGEIKGKGKGPSASA